MISVTSQVPKCSDCSIPKFSEGLLYDLTKAVGKQVRTDVEGHPEVMAAPLEQLRADFPLVPELLGNLVPQQINLWMGCAPDGVLLDTPHRMGDKIWRIYIIHVDNDEKMACRASSHASLLLVFHHELSGCNTRGVM